MGANIGPKSEKMWKKGSPKFILKNGKRKAGKNGKVNRSMIELGSNPVAYSNIIYPLQASEKCVLCKGKDAYGNLQGLCRFGCINN